MIAPSVGILPVISPLEITLVKINSRLQPSKMTTEGFASVEKIQGGLPDKVL